MSRRRVLGGAAALPIAVLIPAPALSASPGRSLFDRRLARYRRAVVRAKAAAESGWFRAANDRHTSERAEVEARLGGWEAAKNSPEGAALCDAIWERLDEAEDAYWHRCTVPMQQAAVTLALTSPPDLEALRAKIVVIREQELETLDRMPRHPLEVLEEDLARLSSASA